MSILPLSLYIHTPFCLNKCPYCDFNSYKSNAISEANYVNALLQDLSNDLVRFNLKQGKLQTIFIGGGTPSLFSVNSIAKILEFAAKSFNFAPDIEITIEANPGTVDLKKCRDYKEIGINRVSLGVQSFSDHYLKALGRVHNARDANAAIKAIIEAGFDNFNLDLMFGLPKHNVDAAANDLLCAINSGATHISWYQLTLEAGTLFAANPPQMPTEDAIASIQKTGQKILSENNFSQYEISAYAKNESFRCRHNLNYWQFGDYLGIGAGAHAKITVSKDQIIRYEKKEQPAEYISSLDNFIKNEKQVDAKELPFEFMLNALRLHQKIPVSLFTQRTFLDIKAISDKLYNAKKLGLIEFNSDYIVTTVKGKDFLNDLLELFL